MSESAGTCLSGLWVMHCLEADIVDVGMGEVVPGRRDANVELARQIHQLLIALAVVGDHVIDLCTTHEFKASESASR